MVRWHRWQKRATSRTSEPHFGHLIVGCLAGVASSGDEIAEREAPPLGVVMSREAEPGRAGEVVPDPAGEAGEAPGLGVVGPLIYQCYRENAACGRASRAATSH
jgi:hypothetical protein